MASPLVYYDAKKHPVNLGDQVGRGGEATIYKLAVQPALLAKIYHGPARSDYGDKLAWMQDNPPADPTRAQNHASIAWPHDLLYDDAGRLAGYVMVHVQNAVPLLQVFNPRLRAKTLPTFNRRYLHRTARNLAAALGALHDSGYVVGDLNESNVMVTPSALVTLIDADSFQVQRRVGAKPILHPCPVGKAEYTPPELQGKTFAQTARLPEHDRFGLGVLIFQLLLEGNHPFRAQWLGAGDPPPVEDRIRDGHWPYAARPGLPIGPPRGVPPLESLHPSLVDLFRKCFIDGHKEPRQRPAPDVWERAISSAEKALTVCRNGHVYSKHLSRCPDCEAIQAAQAAATARAAMSPPPGNAAGKSRHRGRSGPAPRARPVPPNPPRGGAASAPPGGFVWPQSLSALIKLGMMLRQAQSPAAVAVTCRRCGQLNSAEEIYCQQCTGRMGGKRQCGHCQRGIPALSRYCPRCGWRV